MSILISLVFSFLYKIRFNSYSSLNSHFHKTYDSSTLSTLRNFDKQNKKHTKLKNDIRFLEQCNVQNVIPKFLKFKLYRESLTTTNTYRSWQNILLQKEISLKKQQLESTANLVSELRKQLKQRTSHFDFYASISFLNKNLNRLNDAIISTHNRKLEYLGATPHVNSCDPDSVIFNFSNASLSSRLKFLLSFGLQFGIPNFKFRYSSHFAPFEQLACTLKNEPTYNQSFQNVCSIIRNTANHLRKKAAHYSRSFIFKKSDYDLLNTLSNNPSIIISRPDKGRGVVLQNRSEYTEKMLAILSDTTKFKQLPAQTDAIKTVRTQEDKINRFLRKLLDKNVITKSQYNDLYCSGTSLGTMYGLPKVHKHGTPLRPILTTYSTPSYKLSKFIIPLLQPCISNAHTASNSYDFLQKLSTLDLPAEPHMVSYDVTSLFTNIPLKETITIICNKLFHNKDLYHGFTRTDFETIIKLATQDTFFLFNNNIYTQVDGTAMGSPISSTLADVFMSDLESKYLDQCPTSFKPLFYKRYVDDTFTCFSDPAHHLSFHNYINSFHDNIKFTCELSNNHSLPFLDCNINYTNNNFNSSIYRKPTFTGLGTNYHSYIFSKFKTNAISTLINRAYKLCTNYESIDTEISFLRKFFTNNGYPSKLFDSIVTNFFNNIFSPPIASTNVPKKSFFVSLPFYGPPSEKTYKKLFTLLSPIYPQLSFKPILINKRTIGSLFPLKDRTPAEMRSNVIYEYTCGVCSDTYVGSTGRRSVERFHEHLGISCRTARPLASPPFSRIRNHAFETGHDVSLQYFKIIDQVPHNILHITESLHILQRKPNLNDQTASTPLFIAT